MSGLPVNPSPKPGGLMKNFQFRVRIRIRGTGLFPVGLKLIKTETGSSNTTENLIITLFKKAINFNSKRERFE